MMNRRRLAMSYEGERIGHDRVCSIALSYQTGIRGSKRDAIHCQCRLGSMLLQLQEQTGLDIKALIREIEGLHYQLAWRAVRVAKRAAPDGVIDDDKIDDILRKDGCLNPEEASRRRWEQAAGARSKRDRASGGHNNPMGKRWGASAPTTYPNGFQPNSDARVPNCSGDPNGHSRAHSPYAGAGAPGSPGGAGVGFSAGGSRSPQAPHAPHAASPGAPDSSAGAGGGGFAAGDEEPWDGGISGEPVFPEWPEDVAEGTEAQRHRGTEGAPGNGGGTREAPEQLTFDAVWDAIEEARASIPSAEDLRGLPAEVQARIAAECRAFAERVAEVRWGQAVHR